MLEFEGEFGRVRLGGGPRGSGVYWVDDAGRWNRFDPSLPASIRNQNFDAPLRNRTIAYGLMQMVRVEVFLERKHVDISWNVRRADTYTLDSISNYLEMFCPGFTVTLYYCIEAWHRERFQTARDAAQRIQRAMGFRSLPLIDKVFMKQIDGNWNNNMTPLIRKGVEDFDRAKGDLANAQLGTLLSRLIVYRLNPKTNQMMILNAGARSAYASIYGKSWSMSAAGRPYDNKTPGEYFSNRVSQAYQDVLISGQPRLDHIRGIVNRPNDDAIWSSYQRLLFRGRWHDGGPVLVCLSDLTEHLDIPFFVDYGHVN